MSDDKGDAVDRIADMVKIAIRGWPIYGIVFGMLWGYGELWLDKKIEDAIAVETLKQPAVVAMTAAVQTNTDGLTRVEGVLTTVQADTTAILLHLAGD